MRGTGKLKAEVETALWELVTAGLLTADGFDNLRALIDPKRRAGQGTAAARARGTAPGAGRCSTWTPPADRTRALEAICAMLLRRYGVVFREVLARESILPAWREVLITLRRLEDRGEVRGGRFVSDFWASSSRCPWPWNRCAPCASEHLSGESVTVSAADPLNLAGILVPGDAWPPTRAAW